MSNIAELKKIKETLEVLINESEKPKFEVNKWYKGGEYLICPTDLTDPNNAKGYGLSSGIWKNFKDFGMNGISKMTEATNSEVQKELTKEAVKRGFKEGVKFKTCLGNIRTGLGKFEFLDYDNVLRFKNSKETGLCPNVFKDGIWATPIKTKTIEELTSDFDIKYRCSEKHAVDFFKQYLTENKQTIIETLNNL